MKEDGSSVCGTWIANECLEISNRFLSQTLMNRIRGRMPDRQRGILLDPISQLPLGKLGDFR